MSRSNSEADNGDRSAARPTGRRPRRAVSVFAAVLVVAGASAAAYAALDKRGPAPKTIEAIKSLPIAAVAVKPETGYVSKRAFSGRIVARRTSRIGFERAGLVTEVMVDDGARVKKGDVLARLDIRILKTRRTETAAQLAEVVARLKLARLTRERRNRLFKRGHSSEQLLDEARTEVDALVAQRARLAATLARIDVDLEKSVLKAPFDAQVADRMMDEGTVATAGQALFRLIEDGKTEARIGVPARLADTLIVGQTIPVTIGAKTVHAGVQAVLPDVTDATRTVTVVLAIRGRAPAPAGTVARMIVDERIEERGYWLPTTALNKGIRGLWAVYVLRRPDTGGKPAVATKVFKVSRASVEVLHVETDRVFVRGTLEPGDLIIPNGTHRVVPNQIVRLTDRAQSAAR